MEIEKFKSKLQSILPLILTYGSDFYHLTQENYVQKVKEIPHKEFLNKCHEGFKLAQVQIIEALLELEEEIKSANNELQDFVTLNPQHPQRKPEYKAIQEKVRVLEYQEASFREAANVIAWNVLGMDQPNIKMFAKPDMHQGYLSDQNLESVLEYAKQVNADENSFALINDITSILGVGDLLVLQKGKIELVEMKEGKMNILITKLFEENKQDDPEIIKELVKMHGDNVVKQIKRFSRQKETMDAVIEYINTGTGKDSVYGVYKSKYEVKAETGTYNELLHSALDRFYTDRKPLLVEVDFGWLGIFDKANRTEQVGAWDFMHYLYHTTNKPWEDCHYLKKPEEFKFTPDNPPEFFIYSRAPIHLVKNKVRVLSHHPLFLIMKSEYAIDLLTDKFGLYVYFDVDKFIKICEEAGLKADWFTQSQLDKFNSDTRIKNLYLPKFNDRYLQLTYKEATSIFSYGYLYRLIYEFQTGHSLVEQIKEVLIHRQVTPQGSQ